MNVTMPDGTVIYDVPDGMSKADLLAKLQRNNYDTKKLLTPPRPGLLGSFMEAATTIPRMGAQATAFAADQSEENRKAFLKAGETKYQPVGGFSKKNTLGENIEAAKELVGGTLGQAVAPAIVGSGAAVAGAPLGGVGAFVAGPTAGYATNTAQYTIQNLYRQAQEQQDAIDAGKTPNHAAVGKAFVAATGSAGLDLAGEQLFAPLTKAFPFAKDLIFGGGKAAAKSAEVLEDALAKGTLKEVGENTTKLTTRQNYTGNILKGVGKGVAFEVPQEIAQQALERWQAGLSLTDADAQEEYKQAAIGAAFLGPLFGGATGILETRAKNRKTEDEEAEKVDNEPPAKGESSYTPPEGVDPATYAETFARFQATGLDEEEAHDAAVQALTPDTVADGPADDVDGDVDGGLAAGVQGDLGGGVGAPTVRRARKAAERGVEPVSTGADVVAGGEGPSDVALSDGEVGVRAPATKQQLIAAREPIKRAFTAAKLDFEDTFGVSKLPATVRDAAADIIANDGTVAPYDALMKAFEVEQQKTEKAEPTIVDMAPANQPIATGVLPKKVVMTLDEAKAAIAPKLTTAPAPAPAEKFTIEGYEEPAPAPAPVAKGKRKSSKPQFTIEPEPYAEALDKIRNYRKQGVDEAALVDLEALAIDYGTNPKAAVTPEQLSSFIDKSVGRYLAQGDAAPTIQKGVGAGSAREEYDQKAKERRAAIEAQLAEDQKAVEQRASENTTQLFKTILETLPGANEEEDAGKVKAEAKAAAKAETEAYEARTGFQDAGDLTPFQEEQRSLYEQARIARENNQINDAQHATIRDQLARIASGVVGDNIKLEGLNKVWDTLTAAIQSDKTGVEPTNDNRRTSGRLSLTFDDVGANPEAQTRAEDQRVEELDRPENRSLARDLNNLVSAFEQGNIDESQFATMTTGLEQFHRGLRAEKRDATNTRARVRGADFIRQRLLEAKRNGDISDKAADLAEWFIQKNPDLVDNLGISIVTPKNGQRSAGQYNSVSRIAKLFKGQTNDTTVVHEILHHLERMLPADIQAAIRSSWTKATAKAEKSANTETLQTFFKAIRDGDTPAATKMVANGSVPRSMYQYVNASEFWTENASRIVEGRYDVRGSVLNRLKQWLRAFGSKVKDLFGLQSDHPVLKALNSLAKADGLWASADSQMIAEGTVFNAPKGPKAPKGPSKTQLKAEAAAKKPSSAQEKVNASIDAQRATTGNLEAATKEGLDEGIGATIGDHDPNTLQDQFGDQLEGIRTGLLELSTKALPTSALLDWVGAKVPALARIVDAVNAMNAMRNNILAGSNKLVTKLDAFVRKHGLEAIASAMHIARLSGVNPMAHADLATALKNDFVRKKYASLLADPNLKSTAKGGYTRAYNQRAKELTETYKAWEALGKQEGGQQLYKEVRQYYKDMYTALRSRLDKNIRAMDISDDSKKNLLAFVRLQKEQGKGSLQAEDYPDVDPSEFPDEYFPFKRFGDNWLDVDASLDKAKGRQFYMFDNKAAMLAFRRKLARDAGIDVNDPRLKMGFNADDLHKHMEQNSAMLKEMFAEIEKAFANNQALGKTEKDKLKDALYQVYLMTLPERSIRRQFVHSKNVTGFSADVLRTLKTSASQYANQLAKLKYATQVEREIESADGEIRSKDRPSDEAAKLGIFKAEIAKRARDQVNPPERGAITSLLNNASFLMFLTSGATAATQFTGIPIRVMPRLLRLYGFKGTVDAMTKWAALHNSIGVRQKQADGSTIWVFPSAEHADMVKNNPLFKKAFDAGNDRGVFGAITDSLIENKATAVGPVQNAAQEGLSATYNMLTGLFNASEKTSREITYMMGFEQEYKKTGDFDASVKAGAKLVDDTLGNYTGVERPSITTANDLARLAFLFKMYAINTTKFFVQNTRAMFKGDVGAMLELGGVLSMGALFHGMTGMPIYSLVNATMNALSKGDDDEEKRKNFMADDADYRFRHQFMPKYFGQNTFMGHSLAEIGTVGLVPAVTGSNIGSRTSFDNMWFREGKPGQNWAETVQNTILANIAGASLVPNFVGAIQDFNQGNITRGLEQALPGFFKGAATAYRLKTEGAETRGGDQLLNASELTDAQLVGQVLGFQPTKLSEVQQQAYALKKRITAVDTQRRQLMQKLNSELYEDQPDKEKIQTVIEKMMEFNAKYPFPDAQITMETLDDSWRAYQQKRQYMLRGLSVSEKQAPYVLPDLIRTYQGYEGYGT